LYRLDDSYIDDLTSQLDALQINTGEATASAQGASSLTSMTNPSVLDAVNTSPASMSPPIIVSNKPIANDSEDGDDDEDRVSQDR
jgi:hypothetical protein